MDEFKETQTIQTTQTIQKELNSSFSKYIINKELNLQWGIEDEAIIKCYAEKASGYQFIYGKCYYYYRNFYLFISVPLAIMTIILSSTQTFMVALKENNSNINENALNIVNMIFTYIVAILMAIHVKFNFEIKIKNCKDIIKKCNSFENEMRTLLNLPIEMRVNPVIAIRNASIDYETISNIEDDIQVPKFILDKYRIAFENKCKLFEF
jgi:hypothetical protein